MLFMETRAPVTRWWGGGRAGGGGSMINDQETWSSSDWSRDPLVILKPSVEWSPPTREASGRGQKATDDRYRCPEAPPLSHDWLMRLRAAEPLSASLREAAGPVNCSVFGFTNRRMSTMCLLELI